MSIKDKASDAAALALAGIIAITPVPAGSTANSTPDTLNHPNPITEMASINPNPMTLPPGVELPSDIAPGQSTQPAQAQPIRYLDVTKDAQQGWALAQTTAASASRGRRVVIISYLDQPTTRALYDAAVPFTQSPTNLPIVGLIRSPATPPPNMARDTPNPLGFDIYYDGAMFPRDINPDRTFAKTDHLAATIRAIHRNYFAATAALNPSDVRVAANTTTGKSSSGGTATGSGSAGGKTGGSGDLASVNFNPEF